MSVFRRGFFLSLPIMLAACTGTGSLQQAKYGALPDEKFPVAKVSIEKIAPELRRQEVAYETAYPAGTIVVDTPARRLYYVLGGGRAMRYGIGVGRNGYSLAGVAHVGRKAEWPSWTPSPNMLRTHPEKNMKYAAGVPGGPNNPLGARAIYLYQGGRDTMFRIHGTNQPQSIGLAMSSGCVRMMNHDVIDLYARVSPGDKVVVIQGVRDI